MGTKYNGTPSEKQALNAFIKFNRAYDTVQSMVRANLKELELTVSQLGVLEALYHLGPMCQFELAQKILRSGGNLTMVIDNLSKSGWVERRPDPVDRRKYQVHLSKTGRKKIEGALPTHIGAIKEMFSVLSPNEQAQLEKLSAKLGLGLIERAKEKRLAK